MSRAEYLDALEFQVVHSTPGRLRLKGRPFASTSLDQDYVCALVSQVPGVLTVRLNRAARSMVVEHDPEISVKMEILACLESLPLEAYLPDGERDHGPDLLDVGFKAAAALATPLLPMPLKAGLSWFLALPVLGRGMETLLTRGLKVQALDAAVRLFSLLRRDYFVSNTVGAILELAAYLENSSTSRSSELLKNLLRSDVDTVRVERDGHESIIPSGQVQKEDVVVCGAGEMIPVDGEVMEGDALVNTSSITGESVPQHVRVPDQVLAGSLVHEGRLRIRAGAVGPETSMARLSRSLERSLRNRSVGQRRSDALADRLVPFTFGSGLGVYIMTGSASRAASVLTVDYSCAIKMAAPVAVRTAMHAAGKSGVLIKGPQALEALAGIDTMVFDKTGTLTKGTLELREIIPVGGFSEKEVLALAAGAEEHYGHPAARAVVQEARQRGLKLPGMSQVDFVVAHGVSAYVQGKRVLVGSRHFIHEDEGVDCTLLEKEEKDLLDQGKTLLYLALEGRLAGIMALQDVLRPEAAQALRRLKSQGVTRMVMLTGDQARSARAMAARLPELDQVLAGLRPGEKAEIIAKMRAEGRRVAFVGDGVNDSPGLLEADVGISMSLGAQLARDAAQVVLIRDNLQGLVLAHRIAGHTEQVLRNCLWSAVGINSALLALAGAGVLPTLASAALHNASTVGILAYAAMNKGENDEYQHNQGNV